MFMNETCKYLIRKFQKINLKTLFTNFLSFSESFSFPRIRIITASTKTAKIAKEIPLSLASKLFSSIAGSFIDESMDFMSRDDRFMIPSIVVAMKVTLAGS